MVNNAQLDYNLQVVGYILIYNFNFAIYNYANIKICHQIFQYLKSCVHTKAVLHLIYILTRFHTRQCYLGGCYVVLFSLECSK